MAHTYDSYRRPLSRSARLRRLRYMTAAIIILTAGLYMSFKHDVRPTPQNFTKSFSRPAVAQQATPPFAIAPQWPAHIASAAVGASGYGVIATTGDAQPRPTASLAKVITALAVLEKHPLKPGEQGPSIPITPTDEQRYDFYLSQGGSVANVHAGFSITERQALEAMLLPSANNIADTTAVWAFGSLEKYRSYANNMVHQFGLKNTSVGSDASGLNPSTQSTAHDLVLLGEIALQHPVIAQIVSSVETSNIPVAGVMPNYNRLVTQHGYAGLKLGDSDEAGITLLVATTSTFKGQKVTFVGAVLGADRAFGPQDMTYAFMESVKASMH